MFDMDRRYLLAGLLIIMLIAFVGGVKYGGFKQDDADQEMILSGDTTGENLPAEATEVQVYVSGEVEKPGLYKLKSGARVYDALQMAGVLPGADIKTVQPARKLQDGETIDLVAEGQNPASVATTGSVVNNSTAATASLPGSGGLININTASVQELDDRLPGIGPALAQRIVEYRSSNGAFASIEDIHNVSGIGDKKFADLKDLITVR